MIPIWLIILLSFGILVLVPEALVRLGSIQIRAKLLVRIVGLLTVIALFLRASSLAGLLVLPYLFLIISIFFSSFRESRYKPSLALLALLFLIIGIGWILAERIDFRPLGFDSLISILTAIHFHFAGFLLTALASLVLAIHIRPGDHILRFALVLGVPLVAGGITSTQVHGSIILEVFAACWMAITGIWVAVRLMMEHADLLSRMGACLLIVGMVLAMAYGLRPYISFDFLSIPWMYRVHGSINVLALSLLWWRFFKK